LSDLTKYTRDLPATLSRLQRFQKIAFEKYQAHLHAVKAMESLPGAEEYVKKATEDASTWEIKSWLSEARIGELLGPGKPGPQKSSKSLEDSNHNSRYFARQFHAVLLSGKLGEFIEKVESQGPVAYRLPITSPIQAKNSGDNEWYTPREYIDAAVKTMGGIDLDPASTEEANQIIKANRFYTQNDDGLEQEWSGRVWMNPPYASNLIGKFIHKLIEELANKNVCEALVLVNNATDTKWFQSMLHAQAICFPAGRIHFWHSNQESASPLQGQAILYFGDHVDLFKDNFSVFGGVVYG